MYKLKNLTLYLKFFILYGLRLLLPIKKNKILFISMSGNSYGGNPKAISDYIQKNDKGVDIIWALASRLKISGKNKTALYSWNYYYHLITSKVIVSDQRLFKTMIPIKRKWQFYVQTWHGTALKKIEADIPSLSKGYEKAARRDSKMIDLFVSGSSFMTQIYKQAFWYSGAFLEVGTPRNDIFFSEEAKKIRDKVCEKLDIGNRKVLLYAPTFRANDSLSSYTIDIPKIHQLLGKEDWCIIVRLHPNLMGQIDKRTFHQKFPGAIDGSSYPDMQELLVVTDLLITDYSSSMFDFIYTGKICVIYATDINTYDRGFYKPIREMPFPIAESNEDLERILSKPIACDYQSFLANIGSFEKGEASRLVYEHLKRYVL